MISVKCINIKRVDRGNLKAFADVELDLSGVRLLTMRAVRVVQQEGQKAWVSMAAQQGRDNRWHLINLIHYKPLKDDIKQAVLAAYEELA